MTYLRVNQLVQVSGDDDNDYDDDFADDGDDDDDIDPPWDQPTCADLGWHRQQAWPQVAAGPPPENDDQFTQADKKTHPSEEVAQWVPMSSSASPSSLTMMTTTSPQDRGKVSTFK